MAVRRRGCLILSGVAALFLAILLRQMTPVQLCCIRIPVAGQPKNEAEVEKMQAQLADRSEGSFLHDLNTVRLRAKARKFGTYVYGPDDRFDLFAGPVQKLDARLQANVDATALIINDVDHLLVKGNTKAWRMKVDPLSTYGICKCERFSDQYSAMLGSPCTGFLLDETHVITASHCVDNVTQLALKRFIFGFHYRPGEDSRELDEAQIYSATDVVYRSDPCDRRDPDVAIVALDRPVNIKASPRAVATPHPNEPVYLVGYPLGLPAKYAGGAVVRANDSKAAYFVANTDGYKGDSGGPVFNAVHQVVGIQVRGVLSLAQPCGCWSSTWCPDTGCRGEQITRISEVPAVAPASPTPFETNQCDGKVLNPQRPSKYDLWLAQRYPQLRQH